MSGLAGVLSLDGTPARASDAEPLLESIAHRGPDGRSLVVSGPLALGHALLATTPEERIARSPQPLSVAGLVVALDGRLDERDELLALPSLDGEPEPTTDAVLLLRAWRAWGESCVERLVGDFALALWDERTQVLVLARDAFGVKPLLYRRDRDALRFASEPQALARADDEPDLRTVSAYVDGALFCREATLARDVRRVPPAHLLVARAGRIELRRHWQLDRARRVRHRSDREYAEHFGHVLRAAVRARLRGVGPIGSDLSGGLDSSAVTAVAQELGAAPVEAFTLAFPGDPDADEVRYAREVAARSKVVAHELAPTLASLDDHAARARRWHHFPGYPNGVMADATRERARARGLRVLLTGTGGDEVVGGSPYYFADLLRAGRVAEFVRQARIARDEPDFLEPSWVPVRYGLRAAMPVSLRRLVRRVVPRTVTRAPWLGPALARVPRPDAVAPCDRGSLAQRESLELLESAWLAEALEVEERASAWSGIEERHPFLDRRVVELALAFPEEQRRRDGVTKHVLRRALADVLPASVRERRDKATFGSLFLGAIASEECARLLEHPLTAELGWVDAGALREARARIVEADARGERATATACAYALWMPVGIELWLRATSG